MIEEHHIAAFKSLLGDRGIITDQADLEPHLQEWRDKFFGRTNLMLAPASTKEAAAAIKYCNEHAIKIVPQGGNTGLVGGSLPGLGEHQEILLSTKRMPPTIKVDAANMTITAGAGATVLQLQEAAAEKGLLFPLSLASEGSCTVGGVISTNAGGVHVGRYGSTRALTLGLEAVLPSGEIYSNLSGLRKDNTGYALDQLLIGAEGTLGLITAATFKLVPAEVQKHTLWLGIPSTEAAIALLGRARKASGDRVSVFEILPQAGLNMVLTHIPNTRSPLQSTAPWHLLIEVCSSTEDAALSSTLGTWLEKELESGAVIDGVIASNDRQAKDFWRLRESMSEAQKHEGGSIKHDISVPVSAIPDFIREVTPALESRFPGCRVTPFGHVGDGNLHFNVMQPKGGDKEAFLANWQAMNEFVHDSVVRFGGSISAEHGIGSLKKAELERTKSRPALDAMKAIKAALDPKNIFNPNALFN